MAELYWISVLGNFSIFVTVGAIILTSAGGVSLACSMGSNYDDEEEQKKDIRIAKRILFSGIVCIIIALFSPSKEEMFAIYGVGGTIDYIQSSDEAKKLPDSYIKAANKFVESYLNEEEK